MNCDRFYQIRTDKIIRFLYLFTQQKARIPDLVRLTFNFLRSQTGKMQQQNYSTKMRHFYIQPILIPKKRFLNFFCLGSASMWRPSPLGCCGLATILYYSNINIAKSVECFAHSKLQDQTESRKTHCGSRQLQCSYLSSKLMNYLQNK